VSRSGAGRATGVGSESTSLQNPKRDPASISQQRRVAVEAGPLIAVLRRLARLREAGVRRWGRRWTPSVRTGCESGMPRRRQ